MIHLFGHFLVGIKEVSSPLYFGKIAPSSKIEEGGVDTFLGCCAKKIWKKPELMDCMFDMTNIAYIPVFSVAELQDLPCVEK